MPDPVSWKVVEKGWTVYDGDGQEVAKVEEIAGDEDADIFDGFAIKPHALGSVKYVPAESVGSIVEGEVRLTIAASDVASLEDMQEEVEEQILPERSTWYQRLAWWTKGRDR